MFDCRWCYVIVRDCATKLKKHLELITGFRLIGFDGVLGFGRRLRLLLL